MYDWIIVADIHRIHRQLDEETDRRKRESLQALLSKKNDALNALKAKNSIR